MDRNCQDLKYPVNVKVNISEVDFQFHTLEMGDRDWLRKSGHLNGFELINPDMYHFRNYVVAVFNNQCIGVLSYVTDSIYNDGGYSIAAVGVKKGYRNNKLGAKLIEVFLEQEHRNIRKSGQPLYLTQYTQSGMKYLSCAVGALCMLYQLDYVDSVPCDHS